MSSTEVSQSSVAATASSTGEGSNADVTGQGATQERTERYTRSPKDVLRLIVFGGIALLFVTITIAFEDSVIGLEKDIVALFAFLGPSIERVLHGALEVVSLVILLSLYLVPVVRRRWRLLGYTVAAATFGSVAMQGVRWFVDRETSAAVLNQLALRAGITDSATSGAVALAQMTAAFIVVGPFVSRRWRRAGAITMAVLVLLRLLMTVKLPIEAFVALPVGAFAGVAILLAFGRPDRRPTLGAIEEALTQAGLPVADLRAASVDARGSTPYFATMVDGTGLFVKVLGSQERAADLLFRVYRFLRFKNVGDDRPFSSLRRTIEHEALIALLARDVGVRTPRLRGIVDVGADSMLLAYEMIDGSSLDGVDDDQVTDDLMRSIWSQIEVLRQHRIAHRDLRRANVFVGDDQLPWMIDFGFSEVAVPQTILDADVAQMLASMAVVVGPERAVRAATDVLGIEAVGDSLPRLQLRALSGATQEMLSAHKGLLTALQQEVIDRCDVEQVEYVTLERANRKVLLAIVVLALATYFLFPQFADLPGIIDQVKDANWWWTPLVILASATTYVAASISLAGAIPDRLPAGPLFMSSVGSSFASKLAPAGLGGMALNVRFLQKQGIDRTVAVSGLGLNTVAGLVGHLSLVGIFLVWAGRDAFGSFTLPDPKWFLIILGAIVWLIVLAMVIPISRRLVLGRLLPVVTKAFDDVSHLLHRPVKVLMLVGGSALVTFAYLTTLFFSTQAFGGGLAFATVGAVFLVGSAIAQAAPTPGGLGAMEAALISGLAAAGLDSDTAVPGVFLYRLFTFWVPILPGWLSFQWMERNDYL